MVCKKAGSTFLLRPVIKISCCSSSNDVTTLCTRGGRPGPSVTLDLVLVHRVEGSGASWSVIRPLFGATAWAASLFIKGGMRSGFRASFGAMMAPRTTTSLWTRSNHDVRKALQCDTQCRVHRQRKAKAECNGRKNVSDVTVDVSLNTVANGVEPGPRGHVGPALMTTRELGSGTRKSQDERTRGEGGTWEWQSLQGVSQSVAEEATPTNTHVTVPRKSAGWPIADTRQPDDAEIDLEPELTPPVLADKRDQFQRALDCVEPTRRGGSPTRRQETTSNPSCPGLRSRACSGTTRHFLRHRKRGGMYRTARDSSILHVSRLSQVKAPNTW